jgi:hypothetical protein
MIFTASQQYCGAMWPLCVVVWQLADDGADDGAQSAPVSNACNHAPTALLMQDAADCVSLCANDYNP